MYSRFDARISVESACAHAGKIVFGCHRGNTRAAAAAKIPKYIGSGLVPGKTFLPLYPFELSISNPDGRGKGAAGKFLAFVTVTVPHVGDVTNDLVLHTLTETTSGDHPPFPTDSSDLYCIPKANTSQRMRDSRMA